MAESPDIVYGRLLESAHISGYGFERMTDELEWLLEGDRWQKVGPGYADVNGFLGSIDLSAFRIDDKKRLHQRIKELQPKASTRAIAKATGTPQSTVARHVQQPDPNGSLGLGSVAPEQGTHIQPDPNGSRPEPVVPQPFERPPKDVADQARKATRKENAAAETAARREASRAAEPIPDGLDLRVGDARVELADVPDGSVALVLTDPPYGDEAEPLYTWLAEWSARVLVPGGSLICYTGQSRLDRDIGIFARQLRYWWTLAMLHHQSQRLPGKFVTAEFKPVLWFVKDHRRGRTLVNDVLRSPKREKDDHDWGQGEGGTPLLIEQLTEPGDLIADPFAGTARWGEIATGMGRRWVGADVTPRGDAQVVA
jgi:hypothetical protein